MIEIQLQEFQAHSDQPKKRPHLKAELKTVSSCFFLDRIEYSNRDDAAKMIRTIIPVTVSFTVLYFLYLIATDQFLNFLKTLFDIFGTYGTEDDIFETEPGVKTAQPFLNSYNNVNGGDYMFSIILITLFIALSIASQFRSEAEFLRLHLTSSQARTRSWFQQLRNNAKKLSDKLCSILCKKLPKQSKRSAPQYQPWQNGDEPDFKEFIMLFMSLRGLRNTEKDPNSTRHKKVVEIMETLKQQAENERNATVLQLPCPNGEYEVQLATITSESRSCKLQGKRKQEHF